MSTIGCVKQVLQSTFIGGCQFNNGRSYRVFYQSSDGAIHAFFTDNFGAQWGGGDQTVMVAKENPMMQTPLSTVMFTDASGQACSRTFYLGKNHDVRVFGVTAGRAFDGRVNQGEFVAAKYSRIGAIAWVAGGIVHLRIYYQATDDHIQEICFDSDRSNSYTKGHTFPIPLKGTALAFICIPSKAGGSPVLKGYYQHSDLRIMEIVWDGNWHAGTFINGNCTVEAQSHISACISSQGQISVYWTNHCGTFHSVTECVCKGGNWGVPKLISVCCSNEGPRLLCCAHVPEKSTQTCVRLFFVGYNELICDARRENEHWGWGGKQGGACQWERC